MEFIKNYISERGLTLESIGVNEYVLSKNDTLALVEIIKSYPIAILGGDVYVRNLNEWTVTYDNWYSERKKTETYEDYCCRSYQETKDYITNYKNSNAFFSLVIDKNSHH